MRIKKYIIVQTSFMYNLTLIKIGDTEMFGMSCNFEEMVMFDSKNEALDKIEELFKDDYFNTLILSVQEIHINLERKI